MRKYIFIGFGSFLGAILRYLLSGGYIYNFPITTLIINVGGAFILAFILTIAFEVRQFDADIRLGLTTGLLGAFTTFSTLCKETVGLMRGGDYFPAVLYMAISVIFGFAASYFGFMLAQKIGSMFLKRNKEPVNLFGAESDVD